MPKALCMTGMVIAILILVLFLLDLVIPASWALSPFKKANWLMDVGFILCAGGLAYLSWATHREQK